MEELSCSKGFKDKDPLFPKIASIFNHDKVKIHQIVKEKISDQVTIRAVFKKAFEANNLKYINPHSFRDTVSNIMKKSSNTTRLLPAFEENYGHSGGYA